MRIVIVGLGQAGCEIARELIEAGHEITVIDTNNKKVEEFTNENDAIGIVGNGASRRAQVQAKIGSTDLLIALTESDEVNLLSCITAKKLGAKYTIARINSGEYIEDEQYLMKEFKIDLIVNEEYDTAKEIIRLITYPSSVKTGVFANGKVDMLELTVKEDSLLKDLKLTELKTKFNSNIIVTSIVRKGKLIIPRGDIVIKEDDDICITAPSADIYNFLNKLKLIEKPVKSIFIVGCGNIGGYLIKKLSKMKFKIKVVDSDKERCIELMKEFPDVEVIHGNGIDSEILIEEGIKNYDCCVSLTGADETNLVVTLFAWSCKVRKLIAKITSINYSKMLHVEEIDNVLSPYFMVISAVHRFIRGVTDNTSKSNSTIKSLYRYAQNMAEAVEFEVSDTFINIGKNLKEMKINKEAVIAYIIRDGKVIIPDGNTSFEKSDRVIVVTSADKNISKIEEILD